MKVEEPWVIIKGQVFCWLDMGAEFLVALHLLYILLRLIGWRPSVGLSH
jgi:hypothetical protein